ncbi:MAG TPA: proton-conducting transporter membrane subunit [Thermotogota bacterium]|nr:proton-conducting transporter membrane subunit [Thermotogota bacterium]HRW91435.1 proton-conducting transporter membrane subunit [Thermotogota bacterium]
MLNGTAPFSSNVPQILLLFAVLGFVFPFLVPFSRKKPHLVLWCHLFFTLPFLLFFFFQTRAFPEGIRVVPGGWGADRGVQLLLNELSLLFMLSATAIFTAVLSYSPRLRKDWKFAFLLDLLFTDLLLLFLANDLFNIYVTMELLSLLSYLLIAGETKNRQIWASLKYMIIGAVGFNLYLFGIAEIYAATGTLNLDLLRSLAPHHLEELTLPLVFLICSFLIKSGAFFFSMWLPIAHSEAPGVVSAFLSGIIVKSGIFFLFRMWDFFQTPLLEFFLTGVGIASAGVGVFLALLQKDMKLILAFSTMSQVGFILLGGPREGAYYAMAHAFFKSLLFLSVDSASKSFQSRNLQRIRQSSLRVPASVTIPFLVGFFALSGLFFCSGGLYKYQILHHQPPWVFWYLEILSVGTVLYLGKMAMVLLEKTSWKGKWLPPFPLAILAFPVLIHGTLLFTQSAIALTFSLSSMLVFGIGLAVSFWMRGLWWNWFPYRWFRVPVVLNGYLVILATLVGGSAFYLFQ